MKKIFALLLALVMVFSLVACASKTETPATETKTEETATETTTEEKTEEDFKELSVVNLSRSGSFYTIIARSDSFLAEHIVKSFSPVFYEVIPLTLEEVFITEMEEKGYGFAE